MKIFKTVAWISSILAVIMMIIGTVALIMGKNLFGVRHEVNYFIVSGNLLLLAITCILARQGCCCKDTKE